MHVLLVVHIAKHCFVSLLAHYRQKSQHPQTFVQILFMMETHKVGCVPSTRRNGYIEVTCDPRMLQCRCRIIPLAPRDLAQATDKVFRERRDEGGKLPVLGLKNSNILLEEINRVSELIHWMMSSQEVK